MRSRSHEFLWAFIFGRKTPRLNVKAPYRRLLRMPARRRAARYYSPGL